MTNKTYAQIIEIADKQILIEHDYSQARYLMREICEINDIDLYTNLDNFIDDKINEVFQDGIIRLLNDEPLGHILGYSWFLGRKLKVNEDVLIPRSETEQLVLNSLLEIEDYFNSFDLDVIDLGCGSGAIGISLKLEEKALNVSLSDISHKALEVTNENANILNADVKTFNSDLLEYFIANNIKFDVIISNPPYILNDEKIERSVKDFEPHLALFGGEDGLDFYRKILKQSKKVLKSPGLLGFEIGYDQKANLTNEIMKVYPDANIKHFKDFAGLDRMIFVFT